ncbi:hypothetical protein EVAR_67360_1 [Eumeta japonica]|uniref:Uncharacterized protein n=1 Tax=Eumeta variegata TaxID=151549 RepID=A0A4C1SLG9_EUMVA|nr:hypothetical protein EVAR_67360_1 [Eumeta japonica]
MKEADLFSGARGPRPNNATCFDAAVVFAAGRRIDMETFGQELPEGFKWEPLARTETTTAEPEDELGLHVFHDDENVQYLDETYINMHKEEIRRPQKEVATTPALPHSEHRLPSVATTTFLVHSEAFQKGSLRLTCVASIYNLYVARAEILFDMEQPEVASVLGVRNNALGSSSYNARLKLSAASLVPIVLYLRNRISDGERNEGNGLIEGEVERSRKGVMGGSETGDSGRGGSAPLELSRTVRNRTAEATALVLMFTKYYNGHIKNKRILISIKVWSEMKLTPSRSLILTQPTGAGGGKSAPVHYSTYTLQSVTLIACNLLGAPRPAPRAPPAGPPAEPIVLECRLAKYSLGNPSEGCPRDLDIGGPHDGRAADR